MHIHCRRTIVCVCLQIALLPFCGSAANGDVITFGTGANEFSMEFVTIGDPSNAADTTGDPNPAGSVGYTFEIGKFEVAEDMINKANAAGSLGITIDSRGPNKPATNLSWVEAATFVNWLNTSSGFHAAYKLEGGGLSLWQVGDPGYDPSNLFRNSLARYVLPSSDEWYKAAFYDPTNGVYSDYATGSDTTPTPVTGGTTPGTAVYNQLFGQGPADITLAGGLSPYGTMGQGGNVGEWEETEFDLVNDLVSSHPVHTSSIWGIRGGDWTAGDNVLRVTERGGGISGLDNVGFRVVSLSSTAIPEPSSLVLIATGGISLLGYGWRRRRKTRPAA